MPQSIFNVAFIKVTIFIDLLALTFSKLSPIEITAIEIISIIIKVFLITWFLQPLAITFYSLDLHEIIIFDYYLKPKAIKFLLLALSMLKFPVVKPTFERFAIFGEKKTLAIWFITVQLTDVDSFFVN